MKTALYIILTLTALLLSSGALALGLFDWHGNWMLKAGMASLAFVLIPYFLFFRFDQKQQAKREQD